MEDVFAARFRFPLRKIISAFPSSAIDLNHPISSLADFIYQCNFINFANHIFWCCGQQTISLGTLYGVKCAWQWAKSSPAKHVHLDMMRPAGNYGCIALLHASRGCCMPQARPDPTHVIKATLRRPDSGHGYSSPLLKWMIAYLTSMGKRLPLNGRQAIMLAGSTGSVHNIQHHYRRGGNATGHIT